jgi:hypothetical protein
MSLLIFDAYEILRRGRVCRDLVAAVELEVVDGREQLCRRSGFREGIVETGETCHAVSQYSVIDLRGAYVVSVDTALVTFQIPGMLFF